MNSLLLLACLSIGQADYSVSIKGPPEARCGVNVAFEAVGECDACAWTVGGLGEGEFVEVEDRSGRQLMFAAFPEPGEYRIELVAARAILVGEKWRSQIARKSVLIVVGRKRPPAPVEPPNPAPSPPVEPVSPVEPQTRFGLEAVASRAASALPESSRAARIAISRSYAEIALRAASGGFGTVAEMVAAQRDLNRAAVGQERARWEPVLAEIGAAAGALAKAGKLVSIDDHVAAWREISAGLSP